MRQMNLAICDDEADILSIVSGVIVNTMKKYDINATVETFTTAEALYKRMKKTEYGLIFLDIEMPGIDGITFAKKMRRGNSSTDIIFISNREDLVFDALRVSPSGFIRKKKFLEDVTAVIDQWMETKIGKNRETLFVETAGGSISVPLDKVLYIEGAGRKQEIHIADRSDPIVIRQSMKDLEEQLQERGFLRVHKGYLVNYRFIRRVKDTSLFLNNDEELPISRLRAAEIKEQYLALMQEENNVIL